MEEELFFVGIRDPIELRKELLTSSKNLIDSLRRYEAFKDLKEEKLQNVLELKHVFDELLVLNRKLRNHLPRIPVKVPTALKEMQQMREGPKPKVVGKPAKIGKNKIDVLEEELAKIEERLGSLE
jgi:polyhydroxyalkanoate synthesis regulator phasin